MKKKAVLPLLLLLSFVLLGLVLHFQRDSRGPHVYRVAFDILPAALNPRDIQVNTDFFLAAQIYLPLFQTDSTGALTSAYLDLDETKALNSEFTAFRLCLKDSLHFSNGEAINLQHLLSSLKHASEVAKIVPPIRRFKTKGQCLSLCLERPSPQYFHRLTAITTALIASPPARFAVGLGPYRLTAISEQMVEVESTPGQDVRQFNKIQFIKWDEALRSETDPLLDLNHLPRHRFGPRPEGQFQNIRRPSFKTYGLVVNYPDAERARRFARCFPRAEFLKVLPIPLQSIPGFLPEGIIGSQVEWRKVVPAELDLQACRPSPSAPVLELMHFETDSLVAVREFFKRNQARLPIPVRVNFESLANVMQAMSSRSSTASVVGIDELGRVNVPLRLGLEYLEPFLSRQRSKRLVNKIDREVEMARASIEKLRNSQSLDWAMADLHRALLVSGQVIPLGEYIRNQAYPVEIDHIVWLGNGEMSGFPDFSKMGWRERGLMGSLQ